MPLDVWFFEGKGGVGVEVSLGGSREEIERTIYELGKDGHPSKILDHVVVDGMLGEVLSALCSASDIKEPDLDFPMTEFLRKIYNLGRDSVFK